MGFRLIILLMLHRPWVRFIIHLCQRPKIHMGINLRGADVAMPQHFLYRSQVATMGQHMGRKAVTQDMGVQVLPDTCHECRSL